VAIAAMIVLLRISTATAGLITTSIDGDLIFELLSAEGANSMQEFGIGTPSTSSTRAERDAIFVAALDQAVPNGFSSVLPSNPVNIGFFPAGSSLDFYEVSDFGGTFFAFSSHMGAAVTPSDRVVFTDSDNSLGFGSSVVQILGSDHWLLHLDDAASFTFDDDDDELLVRVRVEPRAAPITPIAEPPLASILLASMLFLWRAARPR
jgi:hypothetical protein